MSYLEIKNDGAMPVEALTLMGASSKRGVESQIGFFGTGNKYALSLFLRNNLEVRIFSGLKEINITTKPATLAGENYDVVCVDGQSTSITTQMGPTWHTWQAIREVYSNALDCGGASIGLADSASPEAGKTSYYVQVNDKVLDVFNKFNLFFSSKRTSLESIDTDKHVYENGSGTVYRLGIRCNQDNLKSAFDYDVGNIKIGEDRIASNQFSIGDAMWSMILRSDNEEVVKKCLSVCCDKEYIEGVHAQSQFTDYPSSISETAKKVICSRLIASAEMAPIMSGDEKRDCLQLPGKMLAHFMRILGKENLTLPRRLASVGKVVYASIDPDSKTKLMLDSALSLIASSGLHIRYPINVVEFADSKFLGLASGDEILISEKVFSMGQTILISTILEEWVHLKHSVKDETRQMQDATFNEFATMIVNNASQEVAA